MKQSASQSHYDIVIIGGGMVGATLAAMLKSLPLTIAIIEASPEQSAPALGIDARPIALSYGSRQIFSALEIWQQLASHALPINTIHVSERGSYGTTVVSASDEDVPALGYVCEAYKIHQAILSGTDACDNITWYRPAKLQAIKQLTHTSEITIETSVGPLQLTASLLIGADGRNSPLRQSVGVRQKKYDYHQTAIVTNVALKRPHQGIAYERFTPNGPLAMLPMQQQRAGVVWSVVPELAEEFMALSDHAFIEKLQHEFGYRLGRLQQVGRRVNFPLQLSMAEHPVKDNVILVGDAAQALHPVAGQGLNLGMRDIAVLAQVIRDKLQQHGLPAFATVADSYVEQRWFDRRRTVLFSDFVSRIFIPDILALNIARDLGLCAIDLVPPLKRGFVKQNMGMVGSVPDLMCGVPL